MQYIFFVLLTLWLMACNNESKDKTTETKTVTTSKPTYTATDSVTREAQMNFIDGCVDNAKANIGEAKAYDLCKCIFAQAIAKNPDLDSAAIDRLASDTTELAKMADKCQ